MELVISVHQHSVSCMSIHFTALRMHNDIKMVHFKENGYTCKGDDCLYLSQSRVLLQKEIIWFLTSKLFPFILDPFSKGAWYTEKETWSHKRCLTLKLTKCTYLPQVYTLQTRVFLNCQLFKSTKTTFTKLYGRQICCCCFFMKWHREIQLKLRSKTILLNVLLFPWKREHTLYQDKFLAWHSFLFQ